MAEPLPCLTCPVCHEATVFAVRTAQMDNHCHCSSCGHVWRDEEPAGPAAAEAMVRPKPDRRQTHDAC